MSVRHKALRFGSKIVRPRAEQYTALQNTLLSIFLSKSRHPQMRLGRKPSSGNRLPNGKGPVGKFQPTNVRDVDNPEEEVLEFKN